MDNLDPVLVINAQMTSGEDVHIIHLSSSTRSKVSPVPEGTVKVKINSGASFDAVYTPREDGYEEFSSSRFSFTDKLNPGDVVEVTGSYGSLTAKALVTVPDEPKLLDVEYNKDVKHGNASSSILGDDEYMSYWPYAEPNPYDGNAWHEIKVKFQDLPGDSFYRLRVFTETTLVTDEGTEVNSGYLNLDTSSEPVLSSASASEGVSASGSEST